MEVEALAASAVTILGPILVAGGKKAAEVLGEKAAEQSLALWSRIKSWFPGEEKARRTFAEFAEDPISRMDDVKRLIQEAIQKDGEKARVLRNGVKSAGRIEVKQKIETLSGQAFGARLAEWQRGLDIYVEQDVKDVAGTMVGLTIGSPRRRTSPGKNTRRS